jgi:tetratricopeptide (TPR) repeat protein
MPPTDDLDRQLAELLRSAAVWHPAETAAAAPPPAPKRVRELATLADRLAAEDRAAAELLDSLANTPAAWWRTAIVKSPAGRTAGVVRQLLERVRTLVRTSPPHALAVTELAVEIANDISLTAYPSDFVITVRSDAWRDNAYVLQYLGRFPEAIAAIDEAERLLRETAVPEYGLARIQLVRANILTWTDKLPEAISLACEAAKTFLAFGDRVKYATACMTQAVTLHEYGSIREALDIWESIKNEPALDELTRVLIIYNMGLAHRELGSTAKAVEHITLATAEYELLGMNAEATRARWALATTLVSAGKFAAAIPLFDRAWKEFEAIEMDADAALVALELAEALLVIGQSERVPHICRALLDRFTSIGMTSRAITALSYLREVVAIGKAQPPVVRQVREFLRDLPSQGRPTLSLQLHEPER